MAGRRALSRRRVALRRLGLAGAAALAGTAVLVFCAPRAAAVTGFPTAAEGHPCSYPLLAAGTVQSTLQVTTQGVDYPTITSTTEITLPESWTGTDGLFQDGKQQGRSLACFMPVGQFNYQVSPPDVTVKPAAKGKPAVVDLVNSITVPDVPETTPAWQEGLWSITRNSGGYQVAFQPVAATLFPEYLSWTATLKAPGMNVRGPSLQPTTDDGHGTLTWSLPSSPQPPPRITASLSGPWQVGMDIAAGQWPSRWFFDSSWTLDDGVVFDIIVILLGWRVWRRWRDSREKRALPRALILISLLSLACYAWDVIDNYIWQMHNVGGTVWLWENMVLLTIGVLYFLFALGLDWRRTAVAVAAAGSLELILYVIVWTYLPESWMPISYAGPGAGVPGWFGLKELLIALLAGALAVSVLFLGQSAAASYYYWAHSDWWRQGAGAFVWVAIDLINDGHWWIGDGVQWPLYWVPFAGVFALLWAMAGEARGVFFRPCPHTIAHGPPRGAPTERGDLLLMAALAGCLFVGTWGYYDGLSLPLPFLVTFALLAGWGLTRRLSRLDCRAGAAGGSTDSGSWLARHRTDLLAASHQAAVRPATRRGKTAQGADPGAAGPPQATKTGLLQALFPGRPVSAGGGQQDAQPGSPPALTLPGGADPGVTALALGPADTWWDNGTAAVRAGGYLAIAPIAFDTFELWTGGNLSLLTFPFGLQDAIWYIVGEALAWLSGLFLFGVLIPYLRGMRTPVKGFVFGLIAFAAFAADAGVRHVLGVAPYSQFVTDGLLSVALFTTTGLLLDIQTLRRYNDHGLIDTIYRLGSVRVAVTYATTLILVGVSLWQAVYLTDQTAQQRLQNLSSAAQYTNQAAGTAAPHG